MANSTAASYANCASGRSVEVTGAGRAIQDLEIAASRTLASFHIAGKRNTVADALPRFELHLSGRDPHPGREL